MNQLIKDKFDTYTPDAKAKLLEIRRLIFQIAEDNNLGAIEETLKWGEPSYASKSGTPIRIDWKEKSPNQISIFVNCNTTLIETYREVYGHALNCIGKREVALPLDEPLPLPELTECLIMALKYHTLKKLPLLGA